MSETKTHVLSRNSRVWGRTGLQLLAFALYACGSSEPQTTTVMQPSPSPAMAAPSSMPAASPAAAPGSMAAPAMAGAAPVAMMPNQSAVAPPAPVAAGAGAAEGGAGASMAIGGAGAEQPATPASGCDRACLIAVLSSYLDALAMGDPSSLMLAEDVRFTENGAEREIGQGLWQMASAVRAETRADFADPVEGQVGSQLIVDAGSPTILNIRMKVVEGQITEVETTTIAGGSVEGLTPDPLFTQPVDPAARMSREDLLMMAQAYETLLEDGSYMSSGVKFHPDMIRLENGNQTADAASLMAREGSGRGEIPSRYLVIDEEYGLVFGIYEFDNSLVPNELFKIMDGQIRLLNVILTTQGTSGWN
jgi:hypothetical protein